MLFKMGNKVALMRIWPVMFFKIRKCPFCEYICFEYV